MSRHNPKIVRLNKYLARCGVTSRRKADNYIAAGRVRVNGEVSTEMGIRVTPGRDRVTVDGQAISLPEEYVYYLLHKPMNVISTVDDPRGRTTVTDLIKTDRRIYPVGRLDYDTTGVLILTDDGELTNRLTHPSNEIDRTYEAVFGGRLRAGQIEAFRRGIDIGEEVPAQGDIDILWDRQDQSAAHITLHSGRYHEVKRIFEHFGCPVSRLHRVKFAGISCGELSAGEYRALSDDEVKQLRRAGS